MEPVLLPEHNPSSMDPLQLQVCVYATRKTCYMVCRKRETDCLVKSPFRLQGMCFLHTTHVNTILNNSIQNDSNCTGSGACNFRFWSEWPSKQQFLQSSPPQMHGFQCRVATLMLSLELSVNTNLGVKVTASLYTCQKPCREGSRALASMTAATVHHAPVNCLKAQLHF